MSHSSVNCCFCEFSHCCFMYGCEAWCVTLREEHSLRVFENRLLRRIFGPKRDEVTGKWRRYLMRSFMICAAHQI